MIEQVFQWLGVILATLIALTLAAKAIAKMTPTPRDDEVIAKILSVLRKIEETSDSMKPKAGGGEKKATPGPLKRAPNTGEYAGPDNQ